MTTAPLLANETLDFQFDARFVKPQNDTEHNQTALESLPEQYPLRFQNSTSNQLFLHQSMVNSLMGQLIQNGTFPISFDTDSSIVSQIIRALPEIKLENKKWKEFTIDIDVQLPKVTNNTV